MHSGTILTISLFIAAVFAQDYTSVTSSAAATTTDSSVCDDYVTHCMSATSVIPKTSKFDSTSSVSTAIPYTITNTTGRFSNHSKTMITVSTTPTSYANTSLPISFPTSATTMVVPTSILVATGTPIIPDSRSTVTSYTVVPPTASSAATTTTPTTQSGSARKAVHISSVAIVFLGISSLLLA